MASSGRNTGASARNESQYSAATRGRRPNGNAIIENPLVHLTDEELQRDVRSFVDNHLPSVKYENLLRAARVAKDIRIYDELTRDEKRALVRERDVPFSEKGMWIVILTVSIAALLQGFVQSSFNGASLYKEEWGLHEHIKPSSSDNWKFGATNAVPFFVAALVGCPLSLPINYWFGRRGGICVAAFLILAGSIGAAFAKTWYQLFGIRIINGIGMGIKAVSTPILAGETAVGFWRGSAILAWQLWVAFGIMLGFAFNLIFTRAQSNETTLALINASPTVPSLVLFIIAMFFCPESPRFHLIKGPNYDVQKAYTCMRRIRNTELQALRDIYLVYKSLEQQAMGLDFLRQFTQLFQQRRLYNALISTSTVNLAQQLCGINVLAFYSGTLFAGASSKDEQHSKIIPMAYSLGFGAINFLCGLPAVRSIDTLGRRKWLLGTLPFTALFMLAAALSCTISTESIRIGVAAFFLYVFAAVYSPGLGPIPFTLASESFPLSHREAGASWAIAINLGFAGILSIVYPSVNAGLKAIGALGLFSGLNIVALVMVFLLVEETKRRTLEELDHIFAVSKRKFMRFQVFEYLPWLIQRYILVSPKPRPELYEDLIWGPMEGEDLAPFRAAHLLGCDTQLSIPIPEPVELGQSQGRVSDFSREELQFGVYQPRASQSATDQSYAQGMQATNNEGPVGIGY
ncbi:sugar transporter domain-containing protein [Trichoderma breve]|uniref:Sugar transporter domain-containing protein n=1 Tax=Trichoderma breve TaxID=2034170 RepID=A0A9W9E7R1_9HYPO|nr:sugar transporter domain-containing protein [Trichoderma breve]KAJ4862128.1 sugar transporter domain-containing protein [Trichoderma breve]